MKKIIVITTASVLFFLPMISAAKLLPDCASLGSKTPCGYCDLLQLADNVIGFLMLIIFPIATIMVVIGGIVMMTARENPTQASKGREIITKAVVGILIALISWVILDTIFKVLAPGFKGAFGPWNQLSCNPLGK